MSEQNDDRLLDENLARLLSKGADSPTLAPDDEARIIEHLQAKQAELASEKDHAMDTSATLSTRQRISTKSWAMAATALLAIAGVVLVAAFIFSNPGGGDQPQPAVPSPDALQPPRFDVQGLAKKQLEDGTEVIAHEGTKYEVLGAREIRLLQGDLYLIVAKSNKPFVVKTDDGEVRATGTRFAVSVGKETSAAVSQGRVTLSNDADKVELRAGQQGIMRKGERPQRRPARRLSYLVNWAKEALSQDKLLVEKKDSENGLVALDPWGQETRLTLRKYNVDVYIEDGIARTTIDQTFFNHYRWNTEGTFYFPLPPDASVSRLAMYVNGQLNEGGMVERGRGQQIYTDILYQNRDPALLEMMEGNVFKMRIFPLEGRQEKRIFLSYTQKLDELYGTMRYWFPMDHTNSVAKQLSIRVRVKDAADRYDFTSSTHEVVAKKEDGDLVLEYAAEKEKPDQDFLLHLLPSEVQQPARVATCEKDGHKFIFARFTPEIPGKVDPKPRQWIVLNDVSASRSRIELKAQRYIVERLLAEADDDDSLTILNLNTQVEPATHDVAADKRFVPVKDLRTTGFETEPTDAGHRTYVWPTGKRLGGTNLSAGIEAVSEIIREEKPANPHILYLGDGVATDGKTEVFSLVRAIPRGATFVGIGVGKKVDSLFLQSAADQTGGMYTTINPDEDIDWRVFDLVAALNTPRVTKLRVSLKDQEGKDLSIAKTIAYPSSRSLADGETLTVVARSEDKWPAKIVLEGRAGSDKFHLESSLDDAKENAEFIPRLWAKRHIDELTKSDMERKDEIIELSKQYYVVTPFTSLIVLEDDAMYEQYGVERGRKDHWALYPAPKTIEVVKEPVDWKRWHWYGYEPGEDAKIKAVAKPKSVREIVDSVQFRINAPFYYWRPQRFGEGRFSLYQLLDSEADPTRLLAYWYLVAVGAEDAAAGLRPGAVKGSTDSDTPPAETAPPANKPMPVQQYYSVVSDNFLLPNFSSFDTDGDYLRPAFARLRSADKILAQPMLMTGTTLPFGAEGADATPAPFPMLIEDRRSMLTPILGGLREERERKRRLMPSMALASSAGGLGGPLPLSGLRPELVQSFQTELGRRWSRINSDVRNFNRQYGYWDDGGYWGGWNSIDLTRSANARWYGGLQGLLEDEESAETARLDLLPMIETEAAAAEPLPMLMLSGQQQGQDGGKTAAIAWVNVYGQSLKSQPGSCSVLAADYLVKRRNELLEKRPTPAVKKELDAIGQALENLGKASARLEDSGLFWGWQGWNYRPQVWSFQEPTVQVYHNYNWSFDLTRYATGLYSNAFDILNEVADQYAAKPEGEVSDRAKQFIANARENIKPVKIRYGEDGPDLLVAAGDRFAIARQTDMYLEERMVCDGQNVFHLYKELGLAARRPGTELRLSALRQLAPHLVQPAESLAARFNVALSAEAKDERGETKFELRLTPFVQPEDEKQRYYVTIFVTSDGRIRSKVLTVGGKRQLLLTFDYTGDKITAHWFDEDDKELAKYTYTTEPLEDAKDAFAVDLSEYVVFDMPLRKPSYYAEQLESLGDDADPKSGISLRRHRALALIQELHWRRWGGTNSDAQKSLTEAFELMKKNDIAVRLGDLTLLGSAGVYNTWNVLTASKAKLVPGLAESHPVARYFKLRHSGTNEAITLRDAHREGLVGHLAAYRACATWHKLTEHYDVFAERFPGSPLLLAATFYTSNWGNQPEAWQKLYDHPRWGMMAIMMSASKLKTDEQRKQVASSFATMYEKLAKDGYDVPITSQLAGLVKQHASESWAKMLSSKFERAKETKRTASLLHFAEQAMSWGENSVADEAIDLVRERLAENDPLLGQFALAQVHWAGGRFEEALKLYDEIFKRLATDGVAASPALLASAARLAQQAGDHGRAIELEEQALEAEHPHLPELINLQAFRQRYNWLWQQYQAKVAEAVANGDKDAVKDWMARAESAWLRWHEVDRDNFSMMQQMATLQMTAGRQDDAWLYLSTMIDQRPRDANSYYNVGQWYRGRSKLDEAQQWYARAYEWDTANPRWLVERAKLLDQLGRNSEARKLYEQVVDSQWAPGLQGYVNQAKSALSP